MGLIKVVLWILVILVIAYIVSFVSYEEFDFDFGLNETVNNIKQFESECNELNGTFEYNLHTFMLPQCYAYDSDGYKFYWHKDKKGRYYKTRD